MGPCTSVSGTFRLRVMFVPEQRLIGPNYCIEIVDIVEESEVVEYLEDNGRHRAGEGDEVDVANPLAGGRLEHGLGVTEEGPDFHPGDYIVDDP